MRRIQSRTELVALAEELGVNAEWHEPDNQDITARFAGTDGIFDNAGFWAGNTYGSGREEMYVVLHRLLDEPDEHGNRRIGEPIAAVNLATLFAWATGLDDDSRVRVDRLTEARYRQKIAREIYVFGAQLESEAGHRGVGLAARAIVDEVGNRVGRTPRMEDSGA